MVRHRSVWSNMRKFLPAFFLTSLLVICPAAPRAGETPTATVERLNAVLLETMKSAGDLGYQGRYDKLAPVLNEIFDFPTMARIVLGTHWSSISKRQQADFTEAFADYSVGVFASRFDGYDGERFEILGEQPAWRGAVLVQNQIVKSDGEAIAINYLTRPTEAGDNWQIVDTILGGAYSELATRRSEYDGIVEKTGIVSLIDAVNRKTAGFAE
jgi:phospholipid transport system substrate-binding protein